MESARAFANKIWNASRLIFMKMERSGVEPWVPRELNCCLPEAVSDSLDVPLEDRWIFSRLNRCAEISEPRHRARTAITKPRRRCGTSSGTSSATGISS